MLIRRERPKDFNGARKLNEAAFETSGEARLVDILIVLR